MLHTWSAKETFLACMYCFPISDQVMLDDSFFQMSYYARANLRITNEKQKENSHEGITWSEMGKQNVQAEKVYYYATWSKNDNNFFLLFLKFLHSPPTIDIRQSAVMNTEWHLAIQKGQKNVEWRVDKLNIYMTTTKNEEI